LAALRFFYVKTLKKAWSSADSPYPKRAFHLPTILSQEEVARLINAAGTPFHRTLLMVLYATGVRRAELTHLKVTDIDSQRMVIHVRGGKGRKDRDVMLSPKLLDELRQHWQRLPEKTVSGSFPAGRIIAGISPSTRKPFGDFGGKKRPSRTCLAKTTFRQLCLRELSLFTFFVALRCLALRSGRFARKNSRMAICRFDCQLAEGCLRDVRITSGDFRGCLRCFLWHQTVAARPPSSPADVSHRVLRHGVLSRFAVAPTSRGIMSDLSD